MRKGVLAILVLGSCGALVLALLAAQMLQLNPAVGPLMRVRDLAREFYGERLLELAWAPGETGRAVRAKLRPKNGPAERPPERQARELAEFILQNYPRASGRLAWAEVLLEGAPESEAVRVAGRAPDPFARPAPVETASPPPPLAGAPASR